MGRKPAEVLKLELKKLPIWVKLKWSQRRPNAKRVTISSSMQTRAGFRTQQELSATAKEYSLSGSHGLALLL